MKKSLTVAAIVVAPFLAIASGCGQSENRPPTQDEAKSFRGGPASAEFIKSQQQKQAEAMKRYSPQASQQRTQTAPSRTTQ